MSCSPGSLWRGSESLDGLQQDGRNCGRCFGQQFREDTPGSLVGTPVLQQFLERHGGVAVGIVGVEQVGDNEGA